MKQEEIKDNKAKKQPLEDEQVGKVNGCGSHSFESPFGVG